jgi:branched-chain amino acid transport system permease protein
VIYRETGIFHTGYREDMRIFPLALDRVGLGLLLGVAFVVVPLVASEYWLKGLLIPVLCYSLAALGLNLLTGYTGLISLGHSALMAVGAYAAVIAYGRYALSMPVAFALAGIMAAAVGAVVGIPSLRIKGFYLAVSTLAVQFIIEWAMTHVGWISGGVHATINVPPLRLFGLELDSAAERYLLCLVVVAAMTLFAKNVIRSKVGRAWMAIRDRDVAAEIMGISLFKYKLLAFMVSSFYAGVAGALIAFAFYQAANIEEFTLLNSIRILGMVLIGGLGSILGSFLGAAFIVLLPILIANGLQIVTSVTGGLVRTDVVANMELVVFGSLILFFLIVEPLGLARLWKTFKDYLRLWPFPY